MERATLMDAVGSPVNVALAEEELRKRVRRSGVSRSNLQLLLSGGLTSALFRAEISGIDRQWFDISLMRNETRSVSRKAQAATNEQIKKLELQLVQSRMTEKRFREILESGLLDELLKAEPLSICRETFFKALHQDDTRCEGCCVARRERGSQYCSSCWTKLFGFDQPLNKPAAHLSPPVETEDFHHDLDLDAEGDWQYAMHLLEQ